MKVPEESWVVSEISLFRRVYYSYIQSIGVSYSKMGGREEKPSEYKIQMFVDTHILLQAE